MNLQQFRQIFPNLSEEKAQEYFQILSDEIFEQYEINDAKRQAAFFGQIAVESMNLTKTEENLYYTSPERLFSVYHRNPEGNRFTSVAHASQYIKNPEKLANRVYSNRYHNADEASGDGWKYRGQGFLQTTFKANYESLSKGTGVDFVSKPELLQQPKFAFISAAYYFKSRGCNELADAWELEKLTAKINSAKLDLTNRINYSVRALKILEGN